MKQGPVAELLPGNSENKDLKMKTLVVCSGGLDSITLAYKAAREHELSGLISFDYGQRHKKELSHAKEIAALLNVPHSVIDISNAGAQLSGSALTDDIEVPEGHYAEDSMKATVVPNRNAIMLTIAYGIASTQNLDAVATAVHGGDHFIYPDCRPAFIKSFEEMQNHAQNLEFERAQQIKEKLSAFEDYQGKSTVVSNTIRDVDVFSIAITTRL